MKYLLSSYTKLNEMFYGVVEGVKGTRDLVSVGKLERCGLHGGWGFPRCYQAVLKVIVIKSTVSFRVCVCVLCNYTKV
jgi:hypothetical protein